jgi:protein-S-isoprenylcysteine O-methyltransferase Ste14
MEKPKDRHRKRHEGREDLIGENPKGDFGQMFFGVLFIIIWLLDTFFFQYTTFLNKSFSIFIRIPLGIGLIILSGYLARTGLAIVFGEERDVPCVIRKGVFGIVRHPVYLSEVLLYLGFLIISVSLAAGVVAIFATVFLYYISRYEERLLLSHLGDEYRRYMSEVPMWIPFFRKR